MVQCCVIILLLSLVSLSLCHGPHHPRGSHRHYRPLSDVNSPKLTQDEQLLHDKQHIKEDLGEWVTEEQAKNMSPQELEFHYFKVHDFDNNTKLDGLEILLAIRHTLHENEVKAAIGLASTEGDEEKTDELQHYIALIDRVFDEDDLDNDGYLSYSEYVLGRQKEERGQNANTKSS